MKSGIIAIVSGLAMIIASIAWAEVPNVINNQGRLTTPAGVPLFNDPTNAADGQIDLVFSIYDAPTNGAALWGQTNANVAVHNGLFSVLLGNLGTNVFPATGQVARWLEVTVITNGVASTLSPRKEIVSVAYALRAGDAATWGGLPAAELVGLQTNVAGIQTDLVNIQSNVIYIQSSVAGLQTNVAGMQTNLATLQSNLQINVSNLLGAVGYLVGQTGREPYSSIQAAINAALSNGFSQLRPVTIEVKPGRYTENLSLKAGVHLKSEIEDGLFSVVVVGNHQYAYNGAEPGDLIISGVAFYSPGVTDTNPLFRIAGGSYAALRLNHCVLQSTDNGPALRLENTGVRDGRLSNTEMYHCRVRSLLPTFTGAAVELRNGSLLMDEADIYLANPRARSFLASGAGQLLLDNATIRGWIETKDTVYLQLTQSSIDSGDQASIVHNSATAAVMLETMLVTTLPGVVVLGSGPVLFSQVGFFYSVYGIRQRLHTNPHALPITGVNAANVGYDATFPAHDNWEDLLGGPGPINVRAALDALVNWAVTVPPPFEEVDPIFTAEGFYRDGRVPATGNFDMDGNEIQDANRIQVNSGAAAGRVLTSDADGFGTWAALPPAPPFEEHDPQVDDFMGQFTVPRWRGTNLTGGSITNLDNGNVGIGTPSPIRTLDVNGNAIIRGSLDMNGDEVTNVNRIQVLSNRGTGRVLTSDNDGFGTWQAPPTPIFEEHDPQVYDYMEQTVVSRWRGTNLTNSVIFSLDNGNVGIGTDNPGTRLVVAGNLNMMENYITNVFQIQVLDGRAEGKVLASDAYGYGRWTNIAAIFVEHDPQVDDNMTNHAVARWWGTNLTTGSIWNLNNGNVGIGTTNPLYRLDVNSNAAMTAELSLRQAGFDPVNNNRSCDITHDGTQLRLRMSGAGGRVPINFSMQDDSALFIDGNRNVGIGLRPNDTPRGRLDVRSPTDWYLLGLGVDAGSSTYLRAGNPLNGTVFIGDTQTVRTVIQRNSGNVGIGRKDIPTALLNIYQDDNNDRNSGLYIQRAGSPYGAVMYMDTGGGARIGTKDDGSAADHNRDHIFFSPFSDNVGIGTDNPGARLGVAGNLNMMSSNDIFNVNRIQVLYGRGANKVLTSDANGYGSWQEAGVALKETDPQVDDNLAHNAVPRWDRFADPWRLVTGTIFDNNGAVGLGTASPGAKLDVRGDILIPGGNSLRSDSGYDGTLRLNARGSAHVFIDNDNNSAGESFGVYHDADSFNPPLDTLFTINEAGTAYIKGNVGVGTPAPADKLDVNGWARVHGLRINTGDQRIEGNRYGPYLNYHNFLALRAEDDMTVLVPPPGGFRVTNYENRARGTNTHGNNLILRDDGTLYLPFGFLHESSDSRLKLNQEPLDYGLDEVLALKPIRYIRADSVAEAKTVAEKTDVEESKEQIGLVAQEVDEVIPEAVSKLKIEGQEQWFLSYSKITAVLINAVQEQQEMIDEQKAINAAQEARIKSLEKRIGALKEK